MKACLSLEEKAGVNITPAKLKILMICPMWLMDIAMRYLLNTKIASNVLFG
jgi:hypothetical protein